MISSDSRLMTRRRALFVGATLLAGALASGAFSAEPPVARWRGQALGAHAEMELAGINPADAGALFRQVEEEISRLEAIFSLYRTDSTLVRLNREGWLNDPPPELLEILAIAGAANRQTFGLFDPTVQPLFAFYAARFNPASNIITNNVDVRKVLSRVGFDHVEFDTRQVRFARPGMAMTLNGIAQGYITDRIATMLRHAGFSNVLVDIGEISAVGKGLDGHGWRVGLQAGPNDDTLSKRLRLSDRAVATSMMLGTTFDEKGSAGHILHPRRGLVDRFRPRVTIVDHSAARADALSTAAVLMNDEELASLRTSGVEIYL
jgi:FAD:protein FMN transferase